MRGSLNQAMEKKRKGRNNPRPLVVSMFRQTLPGRIRQFLTDQALHLPVHRAHYLEKLLVRWVLSKFFVAAECSQKRMDDGGYNPGEEENGQKMREVRVRVKASCNTSFSGGALLTSLVVKKCRNNLCFDWSPKTWAE